MKHLIIVTAFLIFNSCNPLDFGKTKLVHLESDQKNVSFECNDNIVADWSDWFDWSYKDGSYQIDKIGIKVYKQGEKVRIRFTMFDLEDKSIPVYQTEASYNVENYERIMKKIDVDSIVFTNLIVRY